MKHGDYTEYHPNDNSLTGSPEKRDPQPTNRGVEHGRGGGSTSKIDYLSARLEYPKSLTDKHFGGLPLPNDVFTPAHEIGGSGHYRRGVELYPAGRMFWTDNKRDIGAFVIFAGDELDEIRRSTGWTDTLLIERLRPRLMNATRLDFAVDIRAGHPSECVVAFQEGEVKTKIKTVRTVAEVRPVDTDDLTSKGFTAYFGASSSDKLLRVYDKAAELKTLNEVLTRVELQTRKKTADALYNLMLKKGVTSAGKAAIRGHIMFPEIKWYTEAMNAELDAQTLYTRRETDFQTWLEQQVGPAMDRRANSAKYSPMMRAWLLERLQALDEASQSHEGNQSGAKPDGA